MEAAAIKLTRQATFSDEQGRTDEFGLSMVYIVNLDQPKQLPLGRPKAVKQHKYTKQQTCTL